MTNYPSYLGQRLALSWLRPAAGCVLACAVLVAVSVLYIDRPVERFVAMHHRDWRMFGALAAPSLLPLPAASLYLMAYAGCRALRRPTGRHTSLLLSLALAEVVATVAKDELKWLFGRPWPYTWVKYGSYGLHPFTANLFFGAFPSGHTTYIAAPMFVLWWRLPQYRPLWLGVVLATMIGLVGAGFHFVADVIGGFFLGLAAAAGTLAALPKPHPPGARDPGQARR